MPQRKKISPAKRASQRRTQTATKPKDTGGKPKADPKPKTTARSVRVTKKSIPPRPNAKAKAKAAPRKKPETPTQSEDKEGSSTASPEKKTRAPRKKVTLESHLEKYDELLTILDAEIERRQKEREKGIRVFRTIRKNVRELKAQAPKVANAKKRGSGGGNKVSGFVLKCRITEELAEFMQIPADSTVTRNEITNAICMYARVKPGEKRPQMLKWVHLNPEGKRNLQDPNDKMAIIPDDTLRELLDYDQYLQDVEEGLITKQSTNKTTKKKETVVVTDAALKYWVIQRLIQPQIIETLKMEKTEEADDSGEEVEVGDADESDE